MKNMKKEKCEYCGVKSVWKSMHEPNCPIVKKYGYLKIEEIKENNAT
jgi:hypothetical protein